MNKASNFAENRRSWEILTKSDDQILETAPKQGSSDIDVNVLLLQQNYLRLGITYPTDRFYKNNWLINHKNQAALMKSSKNAFSVLLGDSIVAGFLRYPNIWYKFFNENTINCGIGGDNIQNVLWSVENIPLPQSMEYILINCGTNNLDIDDSKNIADGLFLSHLPSRKE